MFGSGEFGRGPHRRFGGYFRRGNWRARWVAPVAGVAIVGIAGGAGAALAGSGTAPVLPHRSARQLLAEVLRAKTPGPMTATVQETASLGLPSLPSIQGLPVSPSLSSALTILSGTHQVQYWYANPTHFRVADSVQFGESDLRANGRQVWLWDSKTQTATHLVLPAVSGNRVRQSGYASSPVAASRGSSVLASPTPTALARGLLAAVRSSTRVTVADPTVVAGRPAYQLVISPRSVASLIGKIVVAVDAHRYQPLQVEVFARGATSPAIEVGYTALSFGKIAASNFTFTPPPGARVKTVHPNLPGAAKPGIRPLHPSHAAGAGPLVLGKGWLSVVVAPPGTVSRVSPQAAGMLAALRRAATRVHGRWGSGWLLHTSLLNVLVRSDGQVLAGAVTRSVLYADAGRIGWTAYSPLTAASG